MEPDPIDLPLAFDPEAATQIEDAAFRLSHPQLVVEFTFVSDVSNAMRQVPYLVATVGDAKTYYRLENY